MDQRLRVWRSVASFFVDPGRLCNRSARLFQHSVGACDQHVRGEESTQLDKIHIMTLSARLKR